MYKLPEDIRKIIHSKFPNVENLDEIVHSIFEEICEKAINDGSCLIHKFGVFYTYKAFSSKRGTFVPRFKFKISRTFAENMIQDVYILSKIQKVMKRVFSSEKEKNTNYVQKRDTNFKLHSAIVNGQRKIKEKVKERMIKDEILEILEEKFEEQ